MHDPVLSDHLNRRIEQDFPQKASTPLGYPSLPFSFPRADLVKIIPLLPSIVSVHELTLIGLCCNGQTCSSLTGRTSGLPYVQLGARLVVVHGETIVEPVAPRTNRMAIESFVDILAHPGLITEEEVLLAKEHPVYLELTSRKGHSLTNGHVAQLAHKTGAPMVLNSDTHASGDIWPAARLQEIVVGAGLTGDDYHAMMKNAESIANRCLT